MKEKEIPHIFYLYLHSKLYERSLTREASIKDIKKFLFQWKIPKKLRTLIIKEMEILGLLTIDNRYYIQFNKPKFNEDDCNKYYEELGIFS